MTGSVTNRVLCIAIIGMFACSSLFGIIAAPKFGENNTPSIQTLDSSRQDTGNENTEGNSPSNWYWPDGNGNELDIRSLLDSYRDNAGSVKLFHTSSYSDSQDGFDLSYKTHGNIMTIHASISDYGIVTYNFDEGSYQSLMVSGMELTNTYGSPVLPYSKVLFYIPQGEQVLDVHVRSESSESIYGLDVVPGPKPVAIYGNMTPDTSLFFNPEFYDSASLLPEQLVSSEIAHHGNEQALMITLNPLQYNPMEKYAVLHSEIVIDVTYSGLISHDEVTFNGWSGYDGANYTILTSDAFVPVLSDFINWKTSLGFQVQVVTVNDILSTYAGRDNPEKVRSFIKAAYTENGTEYFLLIGDCDIVPVREVVDPAGGPGLDNGTEPTDLYYECLDGDWDSNMNSQFGEMNDNVDLFPEVKVGRLPVQTPSQAQHTLQQIISYEKDPVAGDWLNDFMLIAVDCFGFGDGVVMTEGEVNEKYLFDSFFDVFRYYPTDGSLSTANIVSKMNSGVNIIDFFDHGAYDVWANALGVDDVLNLNNGNKSFFAFAMACETAAFDVESVEPVIGEAFFRNPNGGASAYIGATRVAWAGYNCFDGLHNKFWDFFLQDALANRAANPKDALQSAINYMATTFDTTNAPTLETIYQAIYFGDPSLVLYWKDNVTTIAEPTEVNQTVNLNETCLTYNNLPIEDNVDILVKDPLGTIVYSNTLMTDATGSFSVSFTASSRPGTYTVETTISTPFEYTALTNFVVGTIDMTLQIDNDPIYCTNLEFSGTTSLNGVGNATLLDSTDSIIGTTTLSSVGGLFSGLINVTSFGPLHLYVQFDNGSQTCGKSIGFKVSRGDILVIADNAGTDYGPEYPGGWADDNFGDGSNPGDYVLALKDEFNVTVVNTMDFTTPPITFLNEFDAIIVTTGDNYGYPLIAPNNFLLDVLYEYHLNGGEILFEGAAILTVLVGQYPEYLPNLFHAEYVENTMNDGGLELSLSGHPISSGLPSTIPLEAGLGSPYADVFNPINNSVQAASYSGSYVGNSAIIGLAPSSNYGGVVFIGFSIDAISNQAYRDLLIQNSMEFLMRPSLMVSLSDDAMKTGTSETISVEVTDTATGTPVEGADIIFEGCGVSESNLTEADGTCSVILSPTFEGLVQVNVTKGGYLNYSTYIIVYDQSIISLTASPKYLERNDVTLVTITARDFYEHNTLENCFINVTGLGNSETGYTNASGMVDFSLSATTPGLIQVKGSLSGYISSSCNIPVRLNILVLPGVGTELSEYCCWDELMLHWNKYGEFPLYIDYTTFQNASEVITLDRLEELNADVLCLGFTLESMSTSEIDAIEEYVMQGHGFVMDSGALYYNPSDWENFLGLTGLSNMYGENAVIQIEQQYPAHPLFNKISDPYIAGYPMAVYPDTTGWDSSKLLGATYVGLEASTIPKGAIITYRGMVYISTIPEYESNVDDCQLLYNSFLWSHYEIPEHEIALSLDVPDKVEPASTVPISATAMNSGLSTETNVHVYLYIDSILMDSLTIPSFANGTTESLEYDWYVSSVGSYNITATVDIMPGESNTLDNSASEFVVARYLIDYIMVSDEFNWYSAKDNGVNLMITGDDEYETVNLPFAFPYYDYVYDEVHISSNGWLSFVNPQPYDYSNVQYPSSDSRFAYAVAPMWADLYSDSNIYYWETEDWAVIEFNNFEYLSGSPLGTYEVVFYPDGHITFNYLEMYNIYDGTVGLNHGDGIHYNSHESGLLSYAVNTTLAFYYFLPEHDLAAGLTAPDYAFLGQPTELIPYIRNTGNSTEVNVELIMSIDGIEVLSVMTTSLDSLDTFEYPFSWTPSFTGTHTIEVNVTPIPGEFSTTNNQIIRDIYVQAPRNFEIVSPTQGETVDGGIVLVEFDSSTMDELMYIEIYLNNEYITYDYNPYIGEVAVPVFENGTNEITLELYWSDSVVSEATVEFVSTNVIPLLHPVDGDYYNWYMDYDYDNYFLNFTFGQMVNAFDVEVHIYEEIRDATNTTMDSIVFDVIASTINGYVISGSIQGAHIFCITGLASPTMTGHSAQIGDFMVGLDWTEVMHIDETDLWRGYSVWTASSNGTGSACSAFRSNGILATYEASGGYMTGLVVDTSFLPAPDTNPPEWLTQPEYIYGEAGELFQYQFSATDETAVDSFRVDDTTRFQISSSGLLGNIMPLHVGSYDIVVTATDPFNHSSSIDVTVAVQDSIAPTWLITEQSFTINARQDISVFLAAVDFSGIDHWSVNDTRFMVNSTGWLNNAQVLRAGTYILKVSVFDPYQNENTMTIEILVLPATTILEGELFLIYMTVVFTGITVAGFIVILLIRKRRMGP